MEGEQIEEFELFKGVHKKLMDCVWILRVETRQRPKILTAFAVKSGVDHVYAVTSFQGMSWTRIKSTASEIIKARPVTKSGFNYDASIVDDGYETLGLYLVKISVPSGDYKCVEFGDGNIEVGEHVTMIGNPTSMVGSFIIGQVAYDCKIGDDLRFKFKEKEFTLDELFTNKDPCYKHIHVPNGVSPSLRFIGDFYNQQYFIDPTNQETFGSFEKRLVPMIPVIQTRSLNAGKADLGSVGAPIFNAKEQLVGMYLLADKEFQIGIHVSVIKKFIEKSTGFSA